MVFASDKNVTRDVDGFIGVPTPTKAPHAVPLGYLDEVLAPSSSKRLIPSGTDLNTLKTTGYWLVSTAALANTTLNLPAPPIPATGADVGAVRPAGQGLLKVTETESRVIQEYYQVVNLGTVPTYRWALFRRMCSASGTWAPWFLEEPTISVFSEAQQNLAAQNLNASKESPVWIMRADTRGVGTYGTKDGNTWWQNTGGGISAPGWTNATLTNGWANYNPAGGTYLNAQYKRTMAGIVMLRGLIGAGFQNQTIFTLPVGYRPAGQLVFQTVTGGSYGHVVIYPDGKVQLGQNVYGAGSVNFCSLGAISFPCAEVAPNSAWTTLTPLNGFTDYSVANPTWPPMGYYVDHVGRYWLRGMSGRTTSPSVYNYATLPIASKTNQQIHIPAVSNTGFSSQHFVTGELHWKPGANGYTWFSLPTSPIIPVALVPESAWVQVVPLINGWVNYGTASFAGAALWEAPDGIQHWRGLIGGGTAGTIIHNIAATFGQSPQGQSLFVVSATETIGRLDMAYTNLTHNFGPTGWVSLDGIHYLRES